jgi:hypothetical protein
VQDEDVVYYNAGTWSYFFDGSLYGLGGTGFFNSFDLDAISIVGGTLYFSTDTLLPLPGSGQVIGDPADVFRWNGGSSYTRVVDANGTGSLGLPFGANVDALSLTDATHFALSFSGDTNVPGLGTVQDEDVVQFDAGTWSVYFDGTAHGLTSNNQDVDAITLATGTAGPPPPPPPPPPVTFPATSRLDTFNRRNSPNLGSNWLGSNTGYRINSNTLEVRGGAGAPKLFTTSFGANQEAFFTFTDVSALAAAQGVVLASDAIGSSMIRVTYRRPAGTIVVETVTGGIPTQVASFPATFSNRSTLGARLSGGSVTVYRNGTQIGTPVSVAGWAGVAGGGRIGVWFAGTTNTSNGNARIDNFGGGSMP